MPEDEIMSELRQIRAQMLAECGGDMEELFRKSQMIEAEERRKGRRVVSLPPRRPKGYKPDAA